jgi:hypothetical protein
VQEWLEEGKGDGMKAPDGKSANKGVGRLWLLVAAAGGAVAAYLSDPERGKLRRQATAGRVRGAVDAARERGNRAQRLVTDRLSKGSTGMTPLEAPAGEPSQPTVDEAKNTDT